jgi:hypothetical protein
MIRSTAKKGDWLLGVGGKTLSTNVTGHVIYLAKISDVITFDNYYVCGMFQGRDDNVYHIKDEEYVVDECRLPEGHKPYDMKKDKVLISQKFVYLQTKAHRKNTKLRPNSLN